jgi:regulator of sigma E protease
MVTLTYILAGVVLLGLCIFVHELGHLLGGKMVGIKARVFSMGYGKGFIKKKIGDTTYQITLIPLGGYCQFYGEDPSEERSGEGYEFLSAHPLKRILTVAMGPLFNLFFGIILFFMMNLIGYTKETNRVYIPENNRSGSHMSAAYQGGIRTGDRIININGKEVDSFSDIQYSVLFSDGRKLKVTVEREGRKLVHTIVPALDTASGRYNIGVLPYGDTVLLRGIMADDVADKAGLRPMDIVTAIDGVRVKNPEEFVTLIKGKSNTELKLSIVRSGDEKIISITPRIDEYVEFREIDDKGKKGMVTSIHKAGLDPFIQKGNVALNSDSIDSFDAMKSAIKQKENEIVTITIGTMKYRGRALIKQKGYIGVSPMLSPEMVDVQDGFVDAFVNALIEPFEFIALNLKGMSLMFSGKLPVRQNLAGPIRIVKFAGDVAYYQGLAAFILLMAKISIILMVMNFLPIPVVDGGHLVFFTIELIRGKPLNEKVMQAIQTVGVIVLITLGAFVIINDISMLDTVQRIVAFFSRLFG